MEDSKVVDWREGGGGGLINFSAGGIRVDCTCLCVNRVVIQFVVCQILFYHIHEGVSLCSRGLEVAKGQLE